MKPGADDMAGGNHFDPEARYAQLNERVEAQSSRISNFEIATAANFSDLKGAIGKLATSLEDRSRTPWGVLITGAGVMMSFIIAVGSLAYAPISGSLSEIKTSLGGVVPAAEFKNFKDTYENNRVVLRNDVDARFSAVAAQSKTDFARVEAELRDIVPRAEHERVWTSYDQRFADQQRQIDEVKSNQASTYGVRDVILDYRERLDRLERDRSATGR